MKRTSLIVALMAGAATLLAIACTSAGADGGVEDLPANEGERPPVTSPIVEPGGGGVTPSSPPPSLPPDVIGSPETPVDSGSGGGIISPSAPPAISQPAGRELVAAPIESVDVLTLESFPPQYVVHVGAGLPGGCAEAAGHEVARQGNLVQVVVVNSMPAGPVACTMIYGYYEVNVNLGSDFTSGVEYTVLVNDKKVTFTAQ